MTDYDVQYLENKCPKTTVLVISHQGFYQKIASDKILVANRMIYLLKQNGKDV